jgi:hypothetical protein
MSRAVADQVVLVCDGAIVHVPQRMAHGCPRVLRRHVRSWRKPNRIPGGSVGQPTETLLKRIDLAPACVNFT